MDNIIIYIPYALQSAFQVIEVDLGEDGIMTVRWDGEYNSDVAIPSTVENRIEGLGGYFDGGEQGDFYLPNGTWVGIT